MAGANKRSMSSVWTTMTPKSRVHLQGQEAQLQADKMSPVLHPGQVYPILPPWTLKWQTRCPSLEVQESELPSKCSYHPAPCLHGWDWPPGPLRGRSGLRCRRFRALMVDHLDSSSQVHSIPESQPWGTLFLNELPSVSPSSGTPQPD